MLLSSVCSIQAAIMTARWNEGLGIEFFQRSLENTEWHTNDNVYACSVVNGPSKQRNRDVITRANKGGKLLPGKTWLETKIYFKVKKTKKEKRKSCVFFHWMNNIWIKLTVKLHKNSVTASGSSNELAYYTKVVHLDCEISLGMQG